MIDRTIRCQSSLPAAVGECSLSPKMNEVATETIRSISEAFHGASGPALFRYPESGWWFEWEGKEIAKALLELNPKDVRYEDIIRPIDGSLLPGWTTAEALLWLMPGMIRVCFEVNPRIGDSLFQEILTEVHNRILKDGMTLTQLQGRSLLEAHEAFYCSEDFDWNPKAHAHPLCEWLMQPNQPQQYG